MLRAKRLALVALSVPFLLLGLAVGLLWAAALSVRAAFLVGFDIATRPKAPDGPS